MRLPRPARILVCTRALGGASVFYVESAECAVPLALHARTCFPHVPLEPFSADVVAPVSPHPFAFAPSHPAPCQPRVLPLFAKCRRQVAKIFTHYYVNQEWDLSRCYSSGGMPSSHTSMVMGRTTAIAVLNGMSSPFFAISLMFSLIVMYDATGVRLHAGKQASVLNMIITELPPDHPVSSNTVALKDTLGHTPVQVIIGAIVGIVIGYLVGLLYS